MTELKREVPGKVISFEGQSGGRTPCGELRRESARMTTFWVICNTHNGRASYLCDTEDGWTWVGLAVEANRYASEAVANDHIRSRFKGSPYSYEPVRVHEPSPEFIHGQAHMQAIPRSPSRWAEGDRLLPQHRFERVGSLAACPETINGHHCTEADDVTCVLCHAKLTGFVIRRPIRENTPAPGISTTEEPWSL